MSWLKQGHPELVVQHRVKMALQHLKGWRFHSFSAEHWSNEEPPSPKLKKVFSDVQEDFHVSVCAACLTSSRQGDLEDSGTLPSIQKWKTQWEKKTLKMWKCFTLCIFSNYAKCEVRSMSQNWSLDCFYDAGIQFVILGQNHRYVLLCAIGDLLPTWICMSILLQQPNRFQAFFSSLLGTSGIF